MYDLKTVMSWLEGLTEDDWEEWYSHSEVQNTAKAAMELLKEKEEEIENLKQTAQSMMECICLLKEQENEDENGFYTVEIYRGQTLIKRITNLTRGQLLDIADDFTDSLQVDWVKPKDIIITGSIANYNWSEEYSDIDLHVLYDFKKVDKRVDFVKNYFDAKKKNWNLPGAC